MVPVSLVLLFFYDSVPPFYPSISLAWEWMLIYSAYSDAVGDKPWADSSETPMRDFWKANDTWLPTWGPVKDRGMVVKSVKMWQEGACGTVKST